MLIKVLRESNGIDQKSAATAQALAILAGNSQNHNIICEEGGIKVLLKFLRDGNEKVQGSVAHALWRLSGNSQTHDMIRVEGGIKVYSGDTRVYSGDTITYGGDSRI